MGSVRFGRGGDRRVFRPARRGKTSLFPPVNRCHGGGVPSVGATGMAELNVLFERDYGRHGKIRVTEGTITLGTRTFPRALLADFDIRRPGWISFDAVRAAMVVFGTLVWILVYVAVVVHLAAHAGGGDGRGPGSGFVLVGSLVTVLAICLSGYMLRRSRSLYWFTVRTSSGERYRTRFFGPDPELESVFECLLAGRVPPRPARR